MESEEAGGVAQWDSMSSNLNKGERERMKVRVSM